MKFDGLTALVTGGSRGLGLLIAHELAVRGADLVICARSQQELDVAQLSLKRTGVRIAAIRCDLTSRDDVEDMISDSIAFTGHIDVLINNAGTIMVGALADMRIEDFEQAIRDIFLTMLYPTIALLPHMRARSRGAIANITSIGGKIAVPHLLPYSCAKFATIALSEGLRAEAAQYGIRVTTVIPWLMRTGSPINAFFKGDKAAEWAWFATSDSLRFTAMDAGRAAKKIIDAIERGDAEIIFDWRAKLVKIAHDLAPGFTANFNAIINEFLPASNGDLDVKRGIEIAQTANPRVFDLVMEVASKTHQLSVNPSLTTDPG
ncbi:MAG: SDR family NAD(P)-dependent oxidoreductase [Deltaproteobacteria bacterium]|nr:SDR family NAD(P)-dependent oxidoreductase [Deltaproteobacteria bacterium]